ncbi:hypothetical protein PFICI_13726 [Pestalotiopsis fici W106-1]|uniref:Zn(2)-C6 fungal-type domain-containing protein n=1 Tax=Pestalotiopsis fici (strain W106-1 / CGMCC3.15140) TaxID=1229662 RepID=W3WQ40_PESFW|nr:uncharacterized protein PFICI_13726 [Pestalotiopsis fici W106-1]ETS75242.1 hypothetical protein PFICI_13726 [Pestalotiopsis fici W106-1]
MAAPQSKRAAPSDTSKEDISNQENVSARAGTTRQSNKQQVRHRASVACASCRDRRIRCVVPKGQNECNQCKRSGAECIIKNDDERRRPISKAYMASLSERINMLEGMLAEKGVVPPEASHPSKTRQETSESQDESKKTERRVEKPRKPSRVISPAGEVPSPPDSLTDDFPVLEMELNEPPLEATVETTTIPPAIDLAPMNFEPRPSVHLMTPHTTTDSTQEDVIQRLLSTKGNLSFDQISGRLRFFGPTANSHVYAESSSKFDSREPPEQVRRAERIIRSLTTVTYDYLMDTFWEYYNGVLVVIDREAFETDRESQNPKFYSSFLHITMLAAGYRFADKDREDIIKISLGNRESTLHREAKYMLDIELERPGGIPSVQALLLLGDLECGVGRDNTGWMYSGMANRLAFDVGLHLDCSNNGLSDREVSIRHMTMRACVIYDKYWALFLGRPTSIKNQDIGMDLLSRQFAGMLSKDVNGQQQQQQQQVPTRPPTRGALVQEIFDQLVELMELAGRIVEIRESNKRNNNSREPNMFAAAEAEDNAYLQVINLDRQLQNWYRRLPDYLTWKPANIKTAPFSFFLLHQQYHVSMILLHRSWAKYGSMTDDASTHSHPSPENGVQSPESSHGLPFSAAETSIGLGDPNSIMVDSRTSLSRNICTQQAMRVARICWQHRQRFSGKKIFVTGIQHAGTAAIALVAALAHQQDDADRRSYLGYLEVISQAIHEMSETYHPAERMDALMHAIIVQLKQDMADPYRTRTNSFAQPGMTAGSLQSQLGAASHSWQTGNFSILPARRENLDAEQGGPALKKRTRQATSRRASVFARPPAPFSDAGTAQPTPPGSTQSIGSLGFDLPNSMSNVFTGFGDTSNMFTLDSLQGSTTDMDANDAHRRGPDDFVLVDPATDGSWSTQAHQQEQSASNQDGGFQMSDWVSGPAGLSASLVLNGGAQRADSLCDDVSTSPKEENKELADGDMDWLSGDNGMNNLSPISLGGLVQSVEKAAGSKSDKSVPPRNHELDFFSF